MRIIAGEWRGRRIEPPPGASTRPTSDRAREGLFSMLASRVGPFEGLRVADLFAGTGALGLEALSRGAEHCTFVETDRAALGRIALFLEQVDARAHADLRPISALSLPRPSRPFDILFLDPPYGKGLEAEVLVRLTEPGWVSPGGWISLETEDENPAIAKGFETETRRRFGRAWIHLLRPCPGSIVD